LCGFGRTILTLAAARAFFISRMFNGCLCAPEPERKSDAGSTVYRAIRYVITADPGLSWIATVNPSRQVVFQMAETNRKRTESCLAK
jgi:hypothetical protein